MSEFDATLRQFLADSCEHLAQLDRDLNSYGRDPQNSQFLNNILATIHTIKGACRYFGFSKLSFVTHVGINLLSQLKEGHLQLSPDIAKALASMVEAIREILGNIQNTGKEGNGDYTRLIELMTQLHQNSSRIARAALLHVPASSKGDKPDQEAMLGAGPRERPTPGPAPILPGQPTIFTGPSPAQGDFPGNLPAAPPDKACGLDSHHDLSNKRNGSLLPHHPGSIPVAAGVLEEIAGAAQQLNRISSGLLAALKTKAPAPRAPTPALIVTCAGQRCAIPQANLVELVRLEGEQAHQAVDKGQSIPVYLWRGRRLPLVDLGPGPRVEDRRASPNRPTFRLVVLRTGDTWFGLLADTIVDTEDIFIEPLAEHYRPILPAQGSAVLADGSNALVLDVSALAARDEVNWITQNANGRKDNVLGIEEASRDATNITVSAVSEVRSVSDMAARLEARMAAFSEQIQALNAMAEQIHLQAINATIEAARPRESGQSYAAAVHEVKGLAREAAGAASVAGLEMEALRANAAEVIAGIKRLGELIDPIPKRGTGFTLTPSPPP